MRILFILDSVENPTSANVLMAQRLAGVLCAAGHTIHLLELWDGLHPQPELPGCTVHCLAFADERLMNAALENGRSGGSPIPVRLVRLCCHPTAVAAAFRQLVLHAPRRVVDTRRELEKLDAAFHFEVICAVCAPYRAAFALETAQVQAKKAIWQLDPYASNRDYQAPGGYPRELELLNHLAAAFITRQAVGDYAPGAPLAAAAEKVHVLDFPSLVPPAAVPNHAADSKKRCVFCGSLYPGLREPGFALELFRALGPASGWTLTMAGGGWQYFAADAAQTKAVLGEQFEQPGPVPAETARTIQQAAQAAGIPVLVGIQGVMVDCALHLNDGVPAQLLHSCAAQHLIDRHVPGGLLDVNQARFDTLAQSEAAVLANARHVTGRTSFDRSAVQKLAPQASYYPCNETLRPEFYTPPVWHPRTFGEAPVLLLSQGNYPLKNLHTVLKALPAVLAQYPGAVLRVAGWPPLDKGPLLRPVIDWMFPYQTWCKQLIRRLGLADHVQYTGPLDAAAMRQAYLDADLFLLPSYSENSPNSLGEAMLLGLPCVASAAGGIPDMLQSGVQGMLYGAAGDDAALSAAILQVLALPDHGTALGTAAQIRARVTHDAAKNTAQMIEIYRKVLQREGTL